MRKSILIIILLSFLMAACNKQNTESTEDSGKEIPETTETTSTTGEENSSIKEETPPPEKETEYLDPRRFPVLRKEDTNYKLYTNTQFRGYYYEIYDNQGWQIETGYCSWRFNSLEYVGDSLLKLEVNCGGAIFDAKYYDVENRRVSMTYSKPAGNSQNLVADFTSDDKGIKLVVCDIFNPNVYTEFYDESFTIGVYTAQCLADFSEDESSVTVSYYSNNGEYLTKTFSLMQDDWRST